MIGAAPKLASRAPLFLKAWATMKRIERDGDRRHLAEYRNQMRRAFPAETRTAFAWQAAGRIAIQ